MNTKIVVLWHLKISRLFGQTDSIYHFPNKNHVAILPQVNSANSTRANLIFSSNEYVVFFLWQFILVGIQPNVSKTHSMIELLIKWHDILPRDRLAHFSHFDRVNRLYHTAKKNKQQPINSHHSHYMVVTMHRHLNHKTTVHKTKSQRNAVLETSQRSNHS